MARFRPVSRLVLLATASCAGVLAPSEAPKFQYGRRAPGDPRPDTARRLGSSTAIRLSARGRDAAPIAASSGGGDGSAAYQGEQEGGVAEVAGGQATKDDSNVSVSHRRDARVDGATGDTLSDLWSSDRTQESVSGRLFPRLHDVPIMSGNGTSKQTLNVQADAAGVEAGR